MSFSLLQALQGPTADTPEMAVTSSSARSPGGCTRKKADGTPFTPLDIPSPIPLRLIQSCLSPPNYM